MKAKKLVVTGLALAAVVAIASQSSARLWGNDNHGSMMGGGMTNGTMMGGSGHDGNHGSMMNGDMMNQGMMNGGMMNGYGNNTQSFTTEQQTAINNIEAKYQTELAEKTTVIRTKTSELQAAQANDATTFGEVKTLKNEIYTLEQDYWTLRNTVNQEISSTIGATFTGHMGWDSNNCNLHNDHQGMNGGTPHMYSQRGSMMGNGSSRCNW